MEKHVSTLKRLLNTTPCRLVCFARDRLQMLLLSEIHNNLFITHSLHVFVFCVWEISWSSPPNEGKGLVKSSFPIKPTYKQDRKEQIVPGHFLPMYTAFICHQVQFVHMQNARLPLFHMKCICMERLMYNDSESQGHLKSFASSWVTL